MKIIKNNKIFGLFLIIIGFAISCNSKKETVSFDELDNIKSKSSTEIESFLKKKKFSFVTQQPIGVLWQSGNETIIQFDGNGTLVFGTYDYAYYSKILSQIKKSDYKYSGKTLKNNLSVDSYEKDGGVIFTSMLKDENGRTMSSLTFVKSK